jgi:hypothetical protein
MLNPPSKNVETTVTNLANCGEHRYPPPGLDGPKPGRFDVMQAECPNREIWREFALKAGKLLFAYVIRRHELSVNSGKINRMGRLVTKLIAAGPAAATKKRPVHQRWTGLMISHYQVAKRLAIPASTQEAAAPVTL